ncbi:MAG: peptide deformylase [Deltaproteobacteria bacterium]|nr:peptide deformylase [Deltaproteobacteria bacterium]NIS78328.1 peptide deformylase [Deltaproteobacteria bacterium]
MKREILKYPDPTLKKVSQPVKEITGEIRELIDDMFETMYENGGVGLAAPQIGVLKRVIVLDVSPILEGQEPLALVNPEIVSEEGEQESEEGCLCIPEFTASVKRAMKVVVRGIDRDMGEVEIEAESFLAKALQHEVDHLNGILIVDRLSPVKRDVFRRKYLKKMKSGAAV